MKPVLALHHASILVRDTRRSLEFYAGVLGMQIDDSRPDLGFPGAWLQAGDQQLHLLELPGPDPVDGRPEHAGHDRHLAWLVAELGVLEQRLTQAGIVFSRSRSGRRALFCRDPDGNGVELIERET